ncbi:hypothetical protein [Flavilitoribacter nigricans]|uniref:AttH domain-containing protein n=1 Tax=Flavilitoribacter nigricans (strain ATCC 23147 / DSM 23189 / NBRC 102662 / NCIMB 1420 / SS-2) TaxID=1122177 RepID=A0A2D0NAX3_FLAN2|nr:hypothetical protein [Flavilitoribacter nigricans]PHN05510.1 hypothetical protein CRP01_16065 [Flavilitoribacter nigricans DSM 23189 = NBRC 102662]
MPKPNFYLDKWFLDFVSPEGEAMIFYAAKLTWRGLTVPYTSWLHYTPETGVRQKSRYRSIHMPEKQSSTISWQDAGFGVAGSWQGLADPITARLFESEEGYLDWHCLQPASEVRLQWNGRTMTGRGYAEQLIMTVPAWKIPMHELRWGRFGGESDQMVWIEIRETDKRQWLWLNGKRQDNCSITDDRIILPDRELTLKMDQQAVLNADKNIFTVVEKMLSFLPGFNKAMPLQFLMADNFKWLSHSQLLAGKDPIATGLTIHEFVNFNSR